MNKKFTKLKSGVLAAVAMSVLYAAPAFAQSNLDYKATAAVNTAGTYTDISATGTAITVANNDDATSTAQNIGFTFNFNGTNFTQFLLNTNGFIKLGTTALSSATVFDDIFGSPDPNLISPLSGSDLTGAANQTANPTSFTLSTTGTAPNRVTTIQFKNLTDKTTGSGANITLSQFTTMNFQIKLYETTNNIEFVYGTWTASANAPGAQIFTVGLKGTSSADADRVGAVLDSPTKPWSQAIFLTTFTFQGTNYYPPLLSSNAALPDAGRTFRFVKYVAPANDLSVEAIYTLGKMPLIAAGNNNIIQAVIKNTGATAASNVPVTLSVTGGAAFNPAPVSIASLAPGASTIVSFPAYVAATPGTKTVKVTLPTDAVATNNTRTTPIEATAKTLSYSIGNSPTSAVGFNLTSNAAFMVKFNVVGSSSVTVPVIRAYISSDTVNIKKTVYAVIVNSSGVEVARSANKVLTAGDLDNTVAFIMTTPPTFTNETFYIGLGQPTYTGKRFYPMGVQSESPGRADAYYTWTLGSTAVPTANTQGIRFMLDADLAVVTGVKEDMNSNVLSVYPNPSNGEFHVSAKDMKGNNLKLEVRDIQGKLVYSANASKENASINMKNAAAGVYTLKVSTDSEVAVKRLIVE